MTLGQKDLIGDIESGISFLRVEHPDRTKFTVAEIMASAGHDRNGSRLHAMIKSLIRKKDEVSLNKIRSMFALVDIKIEPLERWYQNKDNPADLTDTKDIGQSYHPAFIIKSNEKPNDVFDGDIESLSAVLKILAPLPRLKRESILSSAESFFGMGM